MLRLPQAFQQIYATALSWVVLLASESDVTQDFPVQHLLNSAWAAGRSEDNQAGRMGTEAGRRDCAKGGHEQAGHELPGDGGVALLHGQAIQV